MQLRIFLTVSSLAIGCGPAAPKPRPPDRDAPDRSASIANGEPVAAGASLPAPPVGFATSDLVTLVGGELTAWAITDGKLVKAGSATIAKLADADIAEASAVWGLGNGGWVDRDHLFVTIGHGQVVMVTAQAITRVAVPPASAFTAPKPADPEGDMQPGVGSELSPHGLVITAGEAYWSECAWGQPYDGFQCSTWVHARLWPTAAIDRREAPIAARSWPWSAAPAGYTAKVTGRAVACTGPKSKSRIPAGTGADDPDGGEEIESTQWVSADPPRLLVSYGHAGLADVIPERWTLHEGCIVAPLASGLTATPGPSGLWLGVTSEDRGATLYRGARIIGELPHNASVWLRPAK